MYMKKLEMVASEVEVPQEGLVDQFGLNPNNDVSHVTQTPAPNHQARSSPDTRAKSQSFSVALYFDQCQYYLLFDFLVVSPLFSYWNLAY